MKMGRGSGYEYSYDFGVENKIIPDYSSQLRQLCVAGGVPGSKCIVFEIRTSFKLKRIIDGETTTTTTIGSERLGVAVHENSLWWLETDTAFRLKDYWMSDDEIQSLISGALDFALAVEENRKTVGVVVGLDVCTVQQKGEAMRAAIDRAIRPESLMPLYLWYVIIPEGSMRFDETPYLRHKSFLMELPRVRVEDEAGLALMEVCPVCSHNSIIGAQISILPCGHACHSRCVFDLLQQRMSSCPICRAPIPSDWDTLKTHNHQSS